MSMTFDEYQKKAMSTAVDKTDDFVGAFLHRILGLVGEAGEVAEKVKKIVRDKDCQLNETDKSEIIKELGDVLWYVQAVADYLGVPLDEVATKNLEKLSSRKKRDVIRGSGDNR
ncbi:MAG: nucleoside triphosphate pyrophosphohydrolase family protein [Candidatus Saccharimonadales bacterium]